MSFQTGIIEALRDWGLVVHETSGWRTRGSSDFSPRGHVVHHDVIGPTGSTPNIIIAGRSDLPGPLANFWLERDGDVHLVAAGRANHAGEGGWRGLSGNSTVWGTEMNNLGTPATPWPEVQLEAMVKLSAATAQFSGFSPDMVCGHKEWAPTRKVDPHSINMANFRRLVALASPGGLSVSDIERLLDAEQDTRRLILGSTEAILKVANKTLRAEWATREQLREAGVLPPAGQEDSDLEADLEEIQADLDNVQAQLAADS